FRVAACDQREAALQAGIADRGVGFLRRSYPLIALLAALRMKYFWKKITSKMIGTALNIAPARTQFQFTPNNPWNDARPSGSVRWSGERSTMSGHWNSFHEPWNRRITSAARAG